tara:strand:+ start:1932 stop:3395 length:1464 start_codon:yes stop_codon:yes gene_type:complete
MIEFTEWLPDQPIHLNRGVITAENVLPAAIGYRSFPEFVSFSSATSDSKIKGIFAAKDNSGSVKLFVGDAGKLYEFNASTSSLDNKSKAGSPAYDLLDEELWRFVQFGEYVIASGGVGEELQQWRLGVDTSFSNLGGSPPRADFITVVRDFIWTGNIDEGSGRIPYRVRWSGFNAIDSWTAGTDQSDFQDLPDSGAVMGLVGGEYCTILTERAIFRATYTGLPLVFQFDKVESQRGCSIKGSVCNVGSNVFFYSNDGFYLFNGESSAPIGAEKVNKFFAKDFNLAFKQNVTASVDPLNQIAIWSYPSIASGDGTPDTLLIYNYVLNRWSLVKTRADYLAPFFSAGYTMDQLDNLSATLDGLTTVLDSPFYKGGEFFFGGAVNNQIFTFTGEPKSATIETGETTLNVGKHTLVTKIFPYYDGGTVNLQIGTRNNQTDAATFTSSVSPNNDGFAPFRSQGRYHRAKFIISGSWSNALGIDFESTALGNR